MHRILLATLAAFAFGLTAAFPSMPSAEAAGAFLLAPDVSCSRGESIATFYWRNQDNMVTQQWLDLSLVNNGWVEGTYISTEFIAPEATSFVWTGLEWGATHFARLNQQLTDGSWYTTATISFKSRSCATPRLIRPGEIDVPADLSINFLTWEASSRTDLPPLSFTLQVCDSASAPFLYAYVYSSDYMALVVTMAGLTYEWFQDSRALGPARVNPVYSRQLGVRLALPLRGLTTVIGTYTLKLTPRSGGSSIEASITLTC